MRLFFRVGGSIMNYLLGPKLKIEPKLTSFFGLPFPINIVEILMCFSHQFQSFRMPVIKLQSSDGEIFPVDVEIARQSVTIKTMLDDLGMDEDEEEIVPLPNVNAGILKKVILIVYLNDLRCTLGFRYRETVIGSF